MNFSKINYRGRHRGQEFVESLHSTGFALLTHHPIEQQLVEKIYHDWQEFFDSEAKYDYLFDPKRQDGFFPTEVSETAKGHSVKDLKEYFHCYPWGQLPQHLQADINTYYQQTHALATELLDWIDQYCPEDVMTRFSVPLPEMIINSQKTLLRLVHYPPLNGYEEFGAVRSSAHEDVNLITILPAANQPGLQFKTTDGQWLDIPNDFNTLIINCGDMLKEASGGYFPSPTHRVINPHYQQRSLSRLSIPLFLHPNPNVVLSSRHTADSYLQERLRQLGVI